MTKQMFKQSDNICTNEKKIYTSDDRTIAQIMRQHKCTNREKTKIC